MTVTGKRSLSSVWYFGALSVSYSKATGSYIMRSRRSACQAHRSFPYGAEEGWECGSMYRQAPPYLKRFVNEPDFRGPGSVPGQWAWNLCETEWMSASVLPRQRHSVNASYLYAFICHRRYIILAMGNILRLPSWCGYRLIKHRNNFDLALYLDTVTSPATVDETTWDPNSYVMIAWYSTERLYVCMYECMYVCMYVCMLDFRLSAPREISSLLECYVAFVSSYGRFGTTCLSHLQESSFCLTLEDETDRLSQNLAKYFK